MEKRNIGSKARTKRNPLDASCFLERSICLASKLHHGVTCGVNAAEEINDSSREACGVQNVKNPILEGLGRRKKNQLIGSLDESVVAVD